MIDKNTPLIAQIELTLFKKSAIFFTISDF